MKIRLAFPFAAPLLAALTPLGAVEPPADKVDPWVLEKTEGGATAEFIVVLADQADLAGAAELPTKLEKGQWVFERLTEVAARSQGPVLEDLAGRGVEHRAYWVVNAIWVRGDRATVEAMTRREDVARVSANPRVPLRLPEQPGGSRTPSGDIEPNLLQVGVLTFWNAGFTGQEVVVAGQDTGYDWDHPALVNQYRGWNGASADHNYNWHDAIHEPEPVCGPDSPEPCDDSGHGTHTMGTMVGDDGGANRIGMAPGARWIGCRNMNGGFGTVASYTECFEWFIAPTDLEGKNPNPDLAPHVINNSWGCVPPPLEDCADPNILKDVVESTRAAGIVVVVSAGNSGSGCETVETPAAIYEASFTVGAVNAVDNIANFSSRGPVTVDGSDRRKPDVTAPGVSIRSSFPGGGYTFLQGTSMASPHVAGLVALNISADASLAGEVDTLEAHIEGTTLQRTTAQNCGSIPGSEVPNNTYGWGVIRAALPVLFADSFESGDTSAWSQTVPN